MGAPWVEDEGHGIVSDWVTRDKHPGEWILSEDSASKQFYDYAKTMKKARKEGWGLSQDRISALTAKLGRTPSKGEIVADSVRSDFEYLKSWCDNDWHWTVLTVTGPDGEYDCLGGLTDKEEDESCVDECAQDVAARLHDAWQDKQTEEATL
jgi:hypothetical protein